MTNALDDKGAIRYDSRLGNISQLTVLWVRSSPRPFQYVLI